MGLGLAIHQPSDLYHQFQSRYYGFDDAAGALRRLPCSRSPNLENIFGRILAPLEAFLIPWQGRHRAA